MKDQSPIPTIVVTGFLGSGKTTLIASLLKQRAMDGSVVVVNELGAVGIDDAIFAETVDASNVMLLANGCLCCTAGDDLVVTLRWLTQRSPRPRRIVIETTGLADPMPVLLRLMTDTRLQGALSIQGIVATVDAVNGVRNLEDQPIAIRQAAVADLRIITKSDLVEFIGGCGTCRSLGCP